MEDQGFKERIANFEKELNELKAKYQLETGLSLEFPNYKVLPHDLELALLIVQNHKYQFMLSYEDTKGKK
jgi:hypothetical protein